MDKKENAKKHKNLKEIDKLLKLEDKAANNPNKENQDIESRMRKHNHDILEKKIIEIHRAKASIPTQYNSSICSIKNRGFSCHHNHDNICKYHSKDENKGCFCYKRNICMDCGQPHCLKGCEEDKRKEVFMMDDKIKRFKNH